MQDWLFNHVENVYNNVEIEFDIIFDGKIEIIGQITVPFSCIAIFYQMAKYSNINFVSDPMKNSSKTINQ